MGSLQRAQQFEALAPLQFVAHGLGDEATAIALDPVDPGDQLGRHGHGHPFSKGTGARHDREKYADKYDHTQLLMAGRGLEQQVQERPGGLPGGGTQGYDLSLNRTKELVHEEV
jgi:hypothetical protein